MESCTITKGRSPTFPLYGTGFQPVPSLYHVDNLILYPSWSQQHSLTALPLCSSDKPHSNHPGCFTVTVLDLSRSWSCVWRGAAHREYSSHLPRAHCTPSGVPPAHTARISQVPSSSPIVVKTLTNHGQELRGVN